MAQEHYKHAVGTFKDMENPALALTELKAAGFPMDRVSIVAKNPETVEDEAGNKSPDDVAGAEVKTKVGNEADKGAETGAFAGGALGTLAGLLAGIGVFTLPGLGAVAVLGSELIAVGSTVVGGAAGAAAGGLIGGLIGLGIPEEKAKVYYDRVSEGGYLVIIKGTDREIEQAQKILSQRNIENWGIYEPQENRQFSQASS
ncbi:hypothetical protein AY599_21880 [Leptolyngbya valderiana BDU 20041]|uniref:hypothetical protein n=1 Tax=Baaleninema simplex TaxID=2862350 RepID=UPI0003453F4D|nr:hypothetical protein [Baaleninema simplex]MDC0832806.1 hypothetical protein [Geitlerinema sp. CS-897]OAB63671.1 hypothetical protein AY599_21880 [Leptolyngbya valderiana BDU 20041]PPT09652.1 Signal Transduction Histidine Kinase (STHK) LytS [Geitlerinema sp. FC II]